jgi:hypothetical protein
MLETVRRASPERLFAGGLVGPIAACLCIVGFWHVYANVRPAADRAGRVMFALFAVLMVASGAVHTLWTAKGLTLKYCTPENEPCRALLSSVGSYWSIAYNIAAIPGYIGAALLLLLVLAKRTWYPRWTILANPAVLFVLSPLADSSPAPLGAILVGGFANLSIVVFFIVSTFSTWAQREAA